MTMKNLYYKDKKLEEKLQQTFSMWNHIDDCTEIIKQLHSIHYPPSGKYYEFEDGTTCEDWDLEPTIRRKLVEIDQVRKEEKRNGD